VTSFSLNLVIVIVIINTATNANDLITPAKFSQ